jgi:hypothetical protein
MENSRLAMMASRGFRWLRRSRRLPVMALILLLALFLVPRSSQGQIPSPCCALLSAGLGSVTSAITNVVGGGLNAINSTMGSIEAFQRSVVWPRDLIDEARGVVASVQGIFVQIRGIRQTSVASATLPVPKQLESRLLSADPAQASQVTADYAAVYSSVPGPTDASPQMRNLIDMTDAVAEAAMKRAIAIDATSDLELQAADQIIQEIQSAAPGSAPILEAGAAAWLVRSNAYTQAALTELMRLRAIDLANAGAEMKLDAQQGANLRENINGVLRRR